jgi:hypothetical protein
VAKKLIMLFVVLYIFGISPLLPAEKQVRVIAERAPVYAESNKLSYRIETVKKGTILTLFESGSSDADWLYVRYRSERWKSVVTGFIQASMVEVISDEQIKKPKEESVEPVPVEAPEKKAGEKQLSVPQKTQIKEEARPKITKPETKPAKVEPKIAQILVEESIGISSLPPAASYALPEVIMEPNSRVFMSQETLPAATESAQKQQKPLADIAKKAPKKLEEKKPPEKAAAQPESVEKKKAEETKPVEKQITPQITPKKPPRPRKPRPPGKWPVLALNIGYGATQGSGLGGSLQLNTRMGFALNLGAGYYPTSYFYSEYDWVKSEVLFSAGIKYYLPFKSDRIHPYLSLQYGGLSVEAVRLVTGIWHYQYIYENVQKTLYGPSALLGLELKLGFIGLNGAIGLSYNTTEWDYWERDYFFTADVGLLIFIW